MLMKMCWFIALPLNNAKQIKNKSSTINSPKVRNICSVSIYQISYINNLLLCTRQYRKSKRRKKITIEFCRQYNIQVPKGINRCRVGNMYTIYIHKTKKKGKTFQSKIHSACVRIVFISQQNRRVENMMRCNLQYK